jgi:hypothetical protein
MGTMPTLSHALISRRLLLEHAAHLSTHSPCVLCMHAGTLTPIVPNPDDAVMSEEVGFKLRHACTHALNMARWARASIEGPQQRAAEGVGGRGSVQRSTPQRLSATQGVVVGVQLCAHSQPPTPHAAGARTTFQMRQVVKAVASIFPTAIISGRGREKVESFVQLKELFYAGSHGMDIAGPKVCEAVAAGRHHLKHGQGEPASCTRRCGRVAGAKLWVQPRGAYRAPTTACMPVHARLSGEWRGREGFWLDVPARRALQAAD